MSGELEIHSYWGQNIVNAVAPKEYYCYSTQYECLDRPTKEEWLERFMQSRREMEAMVKEARK